jgi:hypothetical protein
MEHNRSSEAAIDLVDEVVLGIIPRSSEVCCHLEVLNAGHSFFREVVAAEASSF